MKVVALGGAGGMGRHAARTAAGFDFVDELCIADRDHRAALALAGELGAKARAAPVDVEDREALVALLCDHDVVLNTVGPSYRFARRCLLAAIEAGCTYLDVCDDWEPTLEMLELGDQAENAGVVAIIGLGASPGVSNLLARLAAAELDTTTALVTGWDLGLATPEARGSTPSAATVHGLHQLSGEVRVWRGGRAIDEAPVQPVVIQIPGRGRHRLYTIGHPEPVTLPRVVPGLQLCLNAMHAPRTHIAGVRVLRWLIDRGLVSVARAAQTAERLEHWLGTGAPAGRLPALFAWAEGTKNGQAARVVVEVERMPAGGMGAATGIPLAMGLRLVHAGALPGGGVFTPEEVIAPEPFLAMLAAAVQAGPAPLVQVRRSW